jgi:hypothetical protein
MAVWGDEMKLVVIRTVEPNEARRGDYIDTFLGREVKARQDAVQRLTKVLKRNGVKRELVQCYITSTHTWQLFLMP